MKPNSRPERTASKLNHTPPPGIADHATFFITINCQKRGTPQLTQSPLPEKLFSSVTHLHNEAKWFPEIFLLMPDHLHALITFSWDPGAGLKKVVENWKRFTARAHGIEWQRDFFDQRIRSPDDHQEKWAYIRENPVKAGLATSYTDWPHVWFPHKQGW